MEKIKQYMQNININREYLSVRFFVAGAILSISFFLLFITIFKTYTSSIIIFVNAKSEVAAQQKTQILGNIAEFPKTLAFYDRFLKYDPDVRDIAAGKSPRERKEAWNDMLSVKKIGKDSSLIKISITTRQQSDADQLVQKTAITLFHFTGFYYNIKNDVDLRSIDGPISHSNISATGWTLSMSIVFGFLITFLLQYILSKSNDLLEGIRKTSKETTFFNFNSPADGESSKNTEQEIKSLEDLYMSDIPMEIPAIPQENSEKVITPKNQEMKKVTKTLEKNKYPNFAEVPKQNQIKSNAPDNLPVADDSFSSQPYLSVEKQSETIKIEKAPKNQPHTEPNAEQIKDRLNKLLRGEF